MKVGVVGFLVLLGSVSVVRAGEFELTGYVGGALPTYSQTFHYEPPSVFPLPGVTVRQEGVFTLDAKGGLAAGGGLAWYFAKVVGLEARVDTLGAEIAISGARFDVSAQLPPPLPPISGGVDLTGGSAEVERLRPLSLNLRLRTPGPVRFTLSGGISYLPEFGATATQPVGLGVAGIVGGEIRPITVALRADTVATESSNGGRLGVNGGVGVQIGLGAHLALAVEGRGFAFKERRLVWSAATSPSSALEQRALEQVLAQLPSVEFSPVFFQVVGGLSLRF